MMHRCQVTILGLSGLAKFVGEDLGEVLGSLEVGYVRPASSGNNGVIRAALGVSVGHLYQPLKSMNSGTPMSKASY